MAEDSKSLAWADGVSKGRAWAKRASYHIKESEMGRPRGNQDLQIKESSHQKGGPEAK